MILRGQYTELANEAAYRHERQRTYDLLEKRFLWWETAFAAEQPRHATHPAPTILYRIQVTSMTVAMPKSTPLPQRRNNRALAVDAWGRRGDATENWSRGAGLNR